MRNTLFFGTFDHFWNAKCDVCASDDKINVVIEGKGLIIGACIKWSCRFYLIDNVFGLSAPVTQVINELENVFDYNKKNLVKFQGPETQLQELVRFYQKEHKNN